LDDIITNVRNNSDDIAKLFGLIGAHYHEVVVPTPVGSFIAAPSATFATSLAPFAADAGKRSVFLRLQSKNLGLFRLNYLENVGYKYINSNFVNAT